MLKCIKLELANYWLLVSTPFKYETDSVVQDMFHNPQRNQ